MTALYVPLLLRLASISRAWFAVRSLVTVEPAIP